MRLDISEYTQPLAAPLTVDELHVINVLYDKRAGIQPGSFTAAMIEAINKADVSNKYMLHQIKPELVDAVIAYEIGNLFERFEHQYLQASENQIKTESGGE